MKVITALISLLAITAIPTISFAQACPTSDPIQVVVDPEVAAAMDQAWRDSLEGTEDEHEEGFFAYQCRSIKPEVCPEEYQYTTEIDTFPTGGTQSVSTPPVRTDPNCRLVLAHHTHPGVGRNSPDSNDPFSNDRQSRGDKNTLARLGVPGTISWGLGDNPQTTMTIYYNPPMVNTPNWFCADPPPAPTAQCQTSEPSDPTPDTSAVGHSYGDPHLITFDQYFYSFQTVGEFVLAQSLDNALIVQSRQIPWSDASSVSLNGAVAANIVGDIVELDGQASTTPTLIVNGSVVLLESVDTLPLSNGGVVTREMNKFEFTWPDGSIVAAKSVKGILELSVNVAEAHRTNMVGLLGNYDGNRNNDIVIRGETAPPEPLNYNILHTDYADSWRVSSATSLFTYADGESTDTFTDKNFPEVVVRLDSFSQTEQDNSEQICSAAGVTDALLLEGCMLDLLSTNDTDFATTASEVQQVLETALVTSELSAPTSSDNECPCTDVFSAIAMDVPPWESNYLNLRTAPGAGCSLSNDLSFLDHESMVLNGRADTQVCTASFGSTNLNKLNVEMTDAQYDACLDIIQNNAKEWFANGHSLDISRNFQNPVTVSSADEIACLR